MAGTRLQTSRMKAPPSSARTPAAEAARLKREAAEAAALRANLAKRKAQQRAAELPEKKDKPECP